MIELTTEQKKIADALVMNAFKKKVQSLGGFAGTGKSTLVRHIAEQLKHFKVCAFTGKAANVLRKKGLLCASTIHSLIYVPEDVGGGEVEFRLRNRHELTECDGFIVDEASMVSQELYDDLRYFGLPIILVGDHGQLEPVGSKANLMADPEYKLEKVHRSAGELAYFAEWIRLGKNPGQFPSKGGTVRVIPNYKVTDNKLKDADQIICAYNKFRVQVNQRVRKMLGRKGIVEVGERVMCLKNNRLRGLFNGMQGVVTRVYETKHFDFLANGLNFYHIPYDEKIFGKDKVEFKYTKDGPEPFEYAYCVTCHKFQGDEADNVLVFEQVCQRWNHQRWAYTAASRAKQSIVWVEASPRKKNDESEWF